MKMRLGLEDLKIAVREYLSKRNMNVKTVSFKSRKVLIGSDFCFDHYKNEIWADAELEDNMRQKITK